MKVFFKNMLHILASRIKSILYTILALVLLLIVCYLFFAKNYLAESSVLIGQGGDVVSGNASPSLVSPSYISTQVGIIESSIIAIQVVNDIATEFDLKSDEELSNFILSGGLTKDSSLTQKIREKLEKMLSTEVKKNSKQYISIRMVEALQDKLKVKAGKESSIIYIRFKSNSPKYSAFVANSFATSYVSTIRILAINNSHITPNINELILNSAKNTDGEMRSYSSESPRILLSPLVQSISESIAQLMAKKGEIYSRVGANHPDYRSIDDQISNLDAQLKLETLKLTQGISITSNMGIGMLEYAYPPDQFSRPPFISILMATILLGILLGILVALIQEKFNPVVRSISNLKSFKGTEIIGTIPPKNYSVYAAILGRISGHHENILE